MDEQDIKVIDCMEKYGGSFVKALAAACRVADNFNLAKIKYISFSDYWREYTEMANNEQTKD